MLFNGVKYCCCISLSDQHQHFTSITSRGLSWKRKLLMPFLWMTAFYPIEYEYTVLCIYLQSRWRSNESNQNNTVLIWYSLLVVHSFIETKLLVKCICCACVCEVFERWVVQFNIPLVSINMYENSLVQLWNALCTQNRKHILYIILQYWAFDKDAKGNMLPH